MKNWLLLVVLIGQFQTFAKDEQRLENLINEYIENSKGFFNWNSGEDVLREEAQVTVLWDKVFDLGSPEDLAEASLTLQGLNTQNFTVPNKLKIQVLKNKLGSDSFKNEIADWNESKWKRSDVLSYLSLKENYSKFLSAEDMALINEERISNFKTIKSDFQKALAKDEWSTDQVKELLTFDPKLRRSLRSYKDKVRLFMFCRHNREHPCLLMMKDSKGKWVKNSSGEFWHQPKLGLSRHGLPSHQVNGDTPQGIYTIDSVMPEANRRLVFGKYRRLILNFINSSRNEADLLSLMPKLTQGLSWWREGTVARDVGRSLLRIHGTGMINTDPASSWYPFYPTSGCIASRENSYDGVKYRDQQDLLNEMMQAAGLRVSYENETMLKGLLYVVDIDSQERAVDISDLAPLL
ncbi:MAG: hypothetical protein K9K67_06180 [Bacteriovoracaceae bacterium]|nr:hypothetical protein [Bacteriovoracaceae bacterium]